MESAAAVNQTFKGEARNFLLLSARAEGLADFRSLSSAIRRAVLPNGEISDDASPQLKRIRAGMMQAREKIQHSLESILRARGELCGRRLRHAAQRSFRDSRARRASAARFPAWFTAPAPRGQTVFVEPLETIDLNNRLVQLREDEAVEIARILEELTERAPRRARSARPPLPITSRISIRFCARAIRARVRLHYSRCSRRTIRCGSRGARIPCSKRHFAAKAARGSAAAGARRSGETVW